MLKINAEQLEKRRQKVGGSGSFCRY